MQVSARRGQAPAVARHHAGLDDPGTTATLGRPHRRLRVERGRRQRVPARPDSFGCRRPPDQSPEYLHRLRQHRCARHDHPPPHPVPGAERSPGLLGRHHPVGVGSGPEPRRRPPRRPIRGSGRRPSTSWPTWAHPPRRLADGPHRRDQAHRHRRRRPSTVASADAGTTIAQGALVTVTGTATDVGGSSPVSRSPSTAAAPGTRPTGTTNWTYSGILTGNGPGAIQVRATDDSARTQATRPRSPSTRRAPARSSGSPTRGSTAATTARR